MTGTVGESSTCARLLARYGAHFRPCLFGICGCGNPIQVSVPGFDSSLESGDLAFLLQPLFAIGCDNRTQLIAFMSKLFRMGVPV